jgi:hypothetical protein
MRWIFSQSLRAAGITAVEAVCKMDEESAAAVWIRGSRQDALRRCAVGCRAEEAAVRRHTGCSRVSLAVLMLVRVVSVAVRPTGAHLGISCEGSGATPDDPRARSRWPSGVSADGLRFLFLLAGGMGGDGDDTSATSAAVALDAPEHSSSADAASSISSEGKGSWWSSFR